MHVAVAYTSVGPSTKMGLFNSLLFHDYLPGDCYHSDIVMDDATRVPSRDVEMHDEAHDTVAPLDETKSKIKNQRLGLGWHPGCQVTSFDVIHATIYSDVPGLLGYGSNMVMKMFIGSKRGW